jgi:hypothetical protein
MCAFAKRNGVELVTDQPTNIGMGTYNLPMTAIEEVDHRKPEVAQPDNIQQLLAAPRSDERQALINKYFAAVADVDQFLEATKAARRSALSAQHDAAVEAARLAAAELARAEEAESEAYASWEKLNQDAKNRGAELTAVQGQFENTNKALLKRSELKTLEAHILSKRQVFAKATAIEGAAFSNYRSLVMAKEEAEAAHHVAVNNAENISKQLDELSK